MANRVVAEGEARAAAEKLAMEIAAFPQTCLRGDRLSAYEQWSMDEVQAIQNEFSHGLNTLGSGESVAGATRFTGGSGRHGEF